MTTEKFNENLDAVISEMKQRLNNKAKEYATEDRLHNFNNIADYTGISADKVALVLLLKNLTSLKDAIVNGQEMSMEFIDEKLIDTECYFVLLRGVLMEKRLHNNEKSEDIKPRPVVNIGMPERTVGERFEFNGALLEVCEGTTEKPYLGKLCYFGGALAGCATCYKGGDNIRIAGACYSRLDDKNVFFTEVNYND